MKPGWIRLQGWMLGAFASTVFLMGLGFCAANDGVCMKAGDVEMKIELSKDAGLALSFAEARS